MKELKSGLQKTRKNTNKLEKNNRDAISTPEAQAKRLASLDEWIKNNPDEYQSWQEKRIASLATPESKAKRKASLKAWREKNPEQAKANAQIRAKAAAKKNSKPICMIDLDDGKVLKTFPSQHEAARWLVEQGKAKNTNCVSSINRVCLGRPIKGHGISKKAYGYGWRYGSDDKDES
ncbi:MAG: hypothetical protein ABW072_13760 [Sedimenticola sp.]